MGSGTDSEEGETFSWTDDELEKEHIASPTRLTNGDGISAIGEDDTTSFSQSHFFSHFIAMGFSEDMVVKAIEAKGEGNTEAVLETLLVYSTLEVSPQGCERVPTDPTSSASKMGVLNKGTTGVFSEKQKKIMFLVDMGFKEDVVTAAMGRCGPTTSLLELQDYIYAAQMAKESDDYREELSHFDSSSSDEDEEDTSPLPDAYLEELPHSVSESSNEYGEESSPLSDESSRYRKRRKQSGEEGRGLRTQSISQRRKNNCEGTKHKLLDDDDDQRSRLVIPTPMIGFGVPGEPNVKTQRKIPEAAIGPPYFYYENVALTPKGVWETISRFLYDIKPEFVDSKFFSATSRKRGYIHNLPIHDRFPIEPRAPRTIQEALPFTKKWWPSWDTRTHLNCLKTCVASSRTTERIKVALSNSSQPPPLHVQKYVLAQCRKWNLVWVGVNKVATLEPDEMEMLLGYPNNHTRGGGISRVDRLKSLGNSFQVDTVAYHLSVLKDIFPTGITVLSLFSGIGGAEVALHRLGIPLKAVVSVEISESSRNIFRNWWEQTQAGTLIDLADVQTLNEDMLKELINRVGRFDLVVGGSPCNNLSGANRVSRNGLEGKHSSLFYDYFRILDSVYSIMEKNV